MPHPHVCDVCTPDLPGATDVDLSEQIRIDLMLIAWLRGLGFGVYGLESHFLHQPLHSFVIDWEAQTLEIYRHPGPAVERGLRILLIYQLHQVEVESGFGRRPVIQHGAIHAEQFTLPPDAYHWMSRIDKLAFFRELFFSATPAPS